MSRGETPKVSSAMTGMPLATASIAAVELTVTSPSAVARASRIGAVDITRFAGRVPSSARSSGYPSSS